MSAAPRLVSALRVTPNAAPERGRDESRPSRQECLRHVAIAANVTQMGGENVSDKVEKDWVSARSLCSLPKVFKELRLQVEEDVKIRNALRPNNSPYEFSVADQGTDFSVLLKTKDAEKSVLFSVSGQAILVTSDHGNQMFKVTVTFNDNGECKLHINEQEHEMWQVRRKALEDILFPGY